MSQVESTGAKPLVGKFSACLRDSKRTGLVKVNSERRHRHMMVGIEGYWRALASTARQLGPTGEI